MWIIEKEKRKKRKKKKRRNADFILMKNLLLQYLHCCGSFLFLWNLSLIYFLLHIVKVQTYDKARNAVALALSPVVRALVDPDGAMRDIRNLDSVRDVLLSNIFGLLSLFRSIRIVAFLFLGYNGETLVPETTYNQ